MKPGGRHTTEFNYNSWGKKWWWNCSEGCRSEKCWHWRGGMGLRQIFRRIVLLWTKIKILWWRIGFGGRRLGGEFIIGILDLELRSSSDVWKCKMRTGSLVYSIKTEETRLLTFWGNSLKQSSFTVVMWLLKVLRNANFSLDRDVPALFPCVLFLILGRQEGTFWKPT